MSKIKSIRTTKGISVFVSGQHPVTIDATAGNYEAVVAAVEGNDLTALNKALNVRQLVIEQSQGALRIENGQIFHGTFALPQTLSDYLLPILKRNGNVEPLVLFVENLLSNPRSFAINELLQFLDYCDLPITPDGHFLAYKKVRADYLDCHSGTMDNSVGRILEMPRYAVNDDRNQTCSAGLHFCSKEYLKSFGGDRIVVVKINPADVVSIPVDYNFSKGRTWRYEVVAELNTLDGELIRELDAYAVSEFDGRDEVVELVTDTKAKANHQGAVSYKKAVVTTTSPIGQHSLSDAQVRKVRKLLAQGMSQAGVAREVGTSEKTVRRIRKGETYKHVV